MREPYLKRRDRLIEGLKRDGLWEKLENLWVYDDDGVWHDLVKETQDGPSGRRDRR